MPVHIARLRIAGFKSFAEPVSVEIRPGLTGIVGPNGCGKSNVVEALRWAMGENSAKSLRGGEMDDVIFAGSGARASRNIAEVTLSLEEAEGLAPPPFHEQPDLQISRRIERGHGSVYRLNGREARARDVQTLFADLASGAQSSAMVGQGRVAAIVNARPEARRMVLEEAAGITGLHSRRHEAELKLRAAEANLERAADTAGQLDTQLAALRRQARQANRYRTISDAIRAAECALFAVQRARAAALRGEARVVFEAAQAAVRDAAGAAQAAARTTAGEALPVAGLRDADGAARTALERHRIAREQLAAEEQRAQDALRAASARLVQIERDRGHAAQVRADAAASLDRLAREVAALDHADDGHEVRAQAALDAARETEDRVREADAQANRATEAAAAAGARHHAATQAVAQAEQRHRRLAAQLADVRREHARIAASAVPDSDLLAAESTLQAAQIALIGTADALAQAETGRQTTQAGLASARDQAAAADAALARPAAEAVALADILAIKDGERWPPMVDHITVPAGLEAALGAALGEELTSAADPQAARHWRGLPPLDPAPALPDGAVALLGLVDAPEALARGLSQIGLVDDGAPLQPALTPGQVLVSRAGGVWRWDGYTIRAGTPTAAALRLRQRNRLAELRSEIAALRGAADAARRERASADAAAAAAIAAEKSARAARSDAEQRLDRARAAASSLRTQAQSAAGRLAAITEQLARLGPEAAEAEAAMALAVAALAELPPTAALRDAVEHARAALSAARAAESAARGARDSLARDHAARAGRRAAIGSELSDWTRRADDSHGRLADLDARIAGLRAEHAALEAAPRAISVRAGEAAAGLDAAQDAHRRAAAALELAVGRAAAADRAARAADADLSAAREQAVRAEAAVGQADHAWGALAERILERLGAPAALPEPPPDLGPETEDRARAKLDRLLRERDEMGPVNLRAEIEAGEIETQVAAIAAEREELASAIAKLRGSIGHLNREGRERLSAVFEQVDRHFQTLFTRMFGGGRAHLAMVGSDDALTAGLEIYAQPPGKKLATLSLLSGGEQALCALSLIFAVFRCNPAPVCVLDEVDAPLDDANVERFCALLEDMARETQTRFLVVTHHPMTMARMDRLYGVTMQERGVSRLLSVDLQAAAAMVEQPRMAAE